VCFLQELRGLSDLPSFRSSSRRVIKSRTDAVRRRRPVSRGRGSRGASGRLEEPESLRSGAAQTDGVIHCAFDHSAFGSDSRSSLRSVKRTGAPLKLSETRSRDRTATGDHLRTGMGNAAPGQPATEDHFDPDHPNPRRQSEVAGAAVSERGMNVR